MKRLRDIFNKGEQVSKPAATTESRKHDDAWLHNVVVTHNLEVCDDLGKVDKILSALDRKGGYCPCGGTGVQFICPCDKIRNMGICTCGLFKNMPERREISSSQTVVKIEQN